MSLPQAQACVHSPSADGVALVLPTTSRTAMESGWPKPQVRERDLSAGRERRGWERRVWAEGNKKIKKIINSGFHIKNSEYKAESTAGVVD